MRAALVRRAILGAFAVLATFASPRFAVAEARPTAPAVELALLPTEARVGDRVVATVRLRADGASATALPETFPDWRAAWPGVEVVAVSPIRRSSNGGETVLEQRLELVAFRPGPVTLPTVDLGCAPDGCSTPADAGFVVASVLAEAEGANPEPAPAQPPRALEVPRAFYWSLGVALVAALATAIAIAHRRDLWRRFVATPRLAPLPELEQALAGAAAGADPATASAEVSLALRRYLGRVFSFGALAESSSEIHRALLGRALAPELVRRAIGLLRDCDQVKFARRSTSASDVARRIGEARAVAEAVQTALAPPMPEAVATAPRRGAA